MYTSGYATRCLMGYFFSFNFSLIKKGKNIFLKGWSFFQELFLFWGWCYPLPKTFEGLMWATLLRKTISVQQLARFFRTHRQTNILLLLCIDYLSGSKGGDNGQLIQFMSFCLKAMKSRFIHKIWRKLC